MNNMTSVLGAPISAKRAVRGAPKIPNTRAAKRGASRANNREDKLQGGNQKRKASVRGSASGELR